MSVSNKNRLRFCILVPVWGERYIKDLCAASLPALFNDGNLPALCRAADCHIMFLTTRDSVSVFENSSAVRNISRYCNYSYSFIDDLMNIDIYGVVLTVAFGRAMASFGDDQKNIHFIFLLSDFVYSDGLLQTVLEKVQAGHDLVLAPSLRCRQEDVSPVLASYVAPDSGELSLTRSELIRLTIDHLHVTAEASLINQDLVYHNSANQFLLKIDEDTIIGRYFLLFLLCIRPERNFTIAKSWFDYSFIPELMPSGKYEIITDSDEGFILELQARRSEIHCVNIGRISPERYCPRLSHWTTHDHRMFARKTIVFHAKKLPAGLDESEAHLENYMTPIFAHLKKKPTSHLDHPYWVSAIRHCQTRIEPEELPKELPWMEIKLSKRDYFSSFFNWMFERVVLGDVGRPTVFHLAFLDYKNLSQAIKKSDLTYGRCLYVSDVPSFVEQHIRRRSTFEFLRLDKLSGARVATAKFDHALITIKDYNLYKISYILQLLSTQCKNDAQMLIYVDGVSGLFFNGRFDLYGDLIEKILGGIGPDVRIIDYSLVTAPTRFGVVHGSIDMRKMFCGPDSSSNLGQKLSNLTKLARLALINIFRRKETAKIFGTCSSATITLTAKWSDISATVPNQACEFDPEYYKRVNTDVAQAGVDPEEHFMNFGWRENRDPSALFSVSGYLSANPDVADGKTNPFLHFRSHGVHEGRNGWQKPYFELYRATNPD